MNNQNAEYWFSAHETAELVAAVEEKGAAFYARLMADSENETVRNMCSFFAEQEREHRKTFKAMARHFRGKSEEYSYSIDVGAILRAGLAEITALFSNRGDHRFDGDDIAGCLDIARRAEETAVMVYGHMSTVYTERFAPILTRIMKEEEKHLQMVKNVQATLGHSEPGLQTFPDGRFRRFAGASVSL